MDLNTISDIEKLIANEVEENLHLDYKAADALMRTNAKKNEISKDVSAFANSDGGIIIYGVREFTDPAKRHLPEKIDPISRIDISKEWLEQVINSNISPRIDGFIVTPIPVDKTSKKVIYVVHIKQSNTAHQAIGHRYYKRYNFESVPMNDFEIRDIMNRNKFPKIELSFEIEKFIKEVKSIIPSIAPFNTHQTRGSEKEYSTSNTLYVFGKNVGGVYANYVNCYLEIPAKILNAEKYDQIESYDKDGIVYKRILCENTIREVKDVNFLGHNTYYKYWPSRYEPILPGINISLAEIELKDNIGINSGSIFWEIYADNAEKSSGQINIADIEKSLKKESEE